MEEILFNSDCTVQDESLQAAMNGLTLLHSEEIATPAGKKPSINWDVYIRAEEMGAFKLYTISRGQDLLGYTAYWIGPIPSCGSLLASMETLYVSKELRGTGIVDSFLTFCEEDVSNLGVEIVSIHTDGSNPHSSLAARLGYDRSEVNYFKGIKKWQV